MKSGIKLVYGVGINDSDYNVHTYIDGKASVCKIYKMWTSMLSRCYSKLKQENYPTYKGCLVCDGWLSFRAFKSWVDTQDWEGKQLDKDILVKGNKLYSPSTCVFVDGAVNSFFIDCGSRKGDHPTGVHFEIGRNKFQSYCSNQFTKKKEFLGRFDCEEDAHQAWRKRKHEIACQLADLQIDGRVSLALRTRYASE